MELAGDLVEVKFGCLTTPDKVGLAVGVLHCNPRGFGFVVPVRPEDGGEDIYVAGEDQAAAMHGDIVVVSLSAARRRSGQGPSGKVVRVLRHARRELLGTYRENRTVAYVEPDDRRFYHDVYIAREDAGGARPGDKVRVRITAWPNRHLNPEGVVEEVLGAQGDPRVETLAVIRGFGLREDFPQDALAEAEALPPRPGPADLDGRLDLREELTFTIDPDDAQDHDDAISIRRVSGGWDLGVHIADVAHYVKAWGALDREARERGTSVYLPGRTLPMLPPRLSNDLCSLREDRVRLTRSALMRFNSQGEMVRRHVVRSVIRSRRSLTYAQVQEVIEGRGCLPEDLTAAILQARELAGLLRERRRHRGMLMLDIPEVRVIMGGDGGPDRALVEHPDEAHGLIEHFMLSANEVVAQTLVEEGLPYVGRVHDEPSPEQLRQLREALEALGYSLGQPGTPRQIQQVIQRTAGREEARAVSICILRAMCRAEYAPDMRGHYGIAARYYTHFTSPIRRYPDLLAHRILTEHESGALEAEGARQAWSERLPLWLRAASEAERRADEAESELTRRFLMDLLLREPDRRLEAVVTDVNDRGALIEITSLAFDGRIRFRHLANDFYRVDERRKRLVGRRGGQIRVGQRLFVRVAEYDPDSNEIYFTPCGQRGA
jgi:ribonuclease R